MAGTYPSLTTYRPSYYNEEARDMPGDSTAYPDGARDFRINGTTATRRWTILYTSDGGLTSAEAQLFIDLANNNSYSEQQGSLLGFDFTPRGESLIANVRFAPGGFVVRRGRKAHIYMIECRLVKYP